MADTTGPASYRGWLLLAAVPVTAIAYWSEAVDPYFAAKLLGLVLVAAAVIALAIRDAITLGPPRRWRGPVLWLFGALAAALVLATLTSPDLDYSLWGVRARYGGLIPWAALLVLGIASASTPTLRQARRLGWVLLATGVVVGLLGAAELLDLWAPADVDGRFGATLGNTNFAGAFLALCAPAGVVLAVVPGGRPARVVAAVAAAFVATMAVLSGALQGPLVLGIEALLLVLWAAGRLPSGRRRALRIGVVALAVVAAASLAAGFAGSGPLEGVRRPGTVARVMFWRTAVAEGLDNPVFGVGLDRYVRESRRYLPPEYAGDLRFTQAVDRAHSVPLQLFATGGVPLAAAHLSVVAASGVAAVQLYRRSEDDDDRAMVVLVGVTWAGYVTQSAVSLDLVPLPVVHMITAGWLLARRWPPAATDTQPEPPTRGARSRSRGARAKAAARRRQVAGVDIAAFGTLITSVALLVVVGAAVVASRPLRAEMAMLDAARAVAADDLATADVRYREAAALVPWDPEPWHRLGVAYQDAGRPGLAVEPYRNAMDIPGGFFSSAVSLGRSLVQLGDEDGARAAYQHAAEVEPRHPDLFAEIANFELETGHPDAARAALEVVFAADPAHPRGLELQSRLDAS